ncbi:MAG: protein kinase [Deltaproteobacteria bacterium]|nr:protein kinase [Deltaproteobacteria bacterium]
MHASHEGRSGAGLLPTQPLFAVGQRFGAFVVEAVAGEGGMGAVYKARDTKLGRLVALKVIRPDVDQGPAAETIARFLREAKVGAALSHPGIAVVYEAGSIGDSPFLAMEWIDGATLAKVKGERTLPVARALEILEAVAEALAYAHGQGVIHRDVKPSNVMVDKNGRVRLVDFGIAKPTKLLGVPGTQMLPTHARAVLGTPAYMAPEQMLSPAVDHRADQFSWGVMAYEVLGNAHPIETVPDDGPAFPVARPKPLAWVRPDLSEAVAAIVHRAMSFEASGRFSTMDELLVALRAARLAATGAAPLALGGMAYGGIAATAPSPSSAPRDRASAPTAGGTWNTTYGQAPSFATAHTPSLEPGYASAPPGMLPSAPPGMFPSAHPSAHPGALPGARPSAPHPRSARHPPRSRPTPTPPAPEKKVPVLALVVLVGGLAVFVGGGAALAFFLAGRGQSPLPVAAGSSPIPSLPGIGGPKSAFIEDFDECKFGATPADVAKAKASLEQRLAGCFDGSVSRDLMFKAEVSIAPDGRVVKVIEQNVCKEDRPSFYLCTERGKTPKRGFPSVPDPVFACLDRTLLATRLPKVTNADADGHVCNADLDIHVK